MTATFWSSNRVEPKRAFRWVGYMNLFGARGSDLGPTPFLVKTFTKPTFSLDSEKLVNNFTSETQLITKHYVWDDISITMYDVENEDLNVSKSIYTWMTTIGYEPIQSAGNLSKFITNLHDNKLNLTLEHINAHGAPMERWSFISPQPTSINFGGELDYESNEVMTVTMGITYVAAEYESLGTNRTLVGQLLNR